MSESFKIYKFDYIKQNQAEIIRVADICHSSLVSDGFHDTTWTYHLYNIFSVASPNIHFLNIYKKLVDIIKENVDGQSFLQAWLNFHDHDQVLDWHDHSSPYHGYISLEPQDTKTEFEEWSIDNECGNIYFGEGNIMHRVVNNSYYTGKRITIGFDVIPASCMDCSKPTKQYGAIPIL